MVTQAQGSKGVTILGQVSFKTIANRLVQIEQHVFRC
jgi:hypothetical protein